MIRRKVDGGLERLFLSAMIHDAKFLRGASTLLDAELLPARHARLVASWCLDHLREHDAAPGKAIRVCRLAWAEREKPEEADAEAVTDFVDALADAGAVEINVAHTLDLLAKYLTDRKMSILRDALDASLTNGRPEDGVKAISDFHAVARSLNVGHNLFSKSAFKRAFAEPSESLIDWPADSAWFFGNDFSRDSTLAFQGSEKRGKSYWLQEVFFRAVRSLRRVAIFQAGDLTERQFLTRVAMRLTKTPQWTEQCIAGVDVPTKIGVVNKEAVVEYSRKTFPHPVNAQTVYRVLKRFNRANKIDAARPTVKYSVHPNMSLSVSRINDILREWRDGEGFQADLIVIDYADILAPEKERRETRDQIGETWRALRRLSQEWHACVVTATQANAQSYGVRTQGMKHFSGNKMKMADVTGMIALNQTAKEETDGVQRLDWIVRREMSKSPTLWVAQCIPLGVALAKAARG